jgi:hypothetical protein
VRFIDGALYSRLDAGQLVKARSTRSRAKGEFELWLDSTGPYTLHAELPGLPRAESAPIEPSFEEPVEGIELAVPLPTTLVGSVLTADSVSPAGTIVGITRGDGHVLYALAADDGSFRFEGLTPGEWQIARCEAEDQQWMRSERNWPAPEVSELPAGVTLAPGTTTRHDLDLSGEVPFNVRGTLLLDGAPAAGWKASVWTGTPAPQATLDEFGRFEVTARRSGRVTLWISRGSAEAGMLMRISQTLDTQPGTQGWFLDLPMGTVELEGLPSAAPPSRYQPVMPEYALLWKDEPAGIRCVLFFEADEEGALRGESVPAGHLSLRRRPGADDLQDPENWPVVTSLEVAHRGRAVYRHSGPH